MGYDNEAVGIQLYRLTREQIEAGLAYYFDHKGALDRVMADSERRVEALQEEFGDSALQKRLRQLKRGR